MTGRILVVDDIEANRRLLRVRLEREYYDVLEAASGTEALDIAQAAMPDLILLDVMMPGMDGFEVCRRLKRDGHTRHIPVVMVTALDGDENMTLGLEAGADEFLTKPVDELVLLARVKSLLRLKVVMDELLSRRAGSVARDAVIDFDDEAMWTGGRILVVGDDDSTSERVTIALEKHHLPKLHTDPATVMGAASSTWDLILLDIDAESFDGLRLAARFASDERTRNIPVLGALNLGERDRMVRALDIGIHDVVFSPVNLNELHARTRQQIRRKRYTDYLRAVLDQSFEASITDALTGLHNRRFLDKQFAETMTRAEQDNKPFAVMVCDLDKFKTINDTYGHLAGDDVLAEFAKRLSAKMRAMDITCRYGGEEFVALLPNSSLDDARRAAERVRTAIAERPFILNATQALDVTVSIGVAEFMQGDTQQKIIDRADQALYAAKERGRNRVVAARVQRNSKAA
jgi:two-component system, cell cycle response regulator